MSITMAHPAPVSRNDALDVWRTLQAARALVCPTCGGALQVGEAQFTCTGCDAVYPVSGGVPLLLRPSDVVSITERVLDAFNIPHAFAGEVKDALATLTEFRATSYPEFANFFARFDPNDVPPRPVPLDEAQARAAVDQVSCLTSSFPKTLRAGQPEYRSLRIRNDSSQVLFTDEHGGLCLNCKVFDAHGTELPMANEPSPLPCPVRPGGELTVPVQTRLPPALEGRFTVRFYFQFADKRQTATPIPPSPGPAPVETWPTRLASHARRLLGRTTVHDVPLPPADPVPARRLIWLDARPLAEMVVDAVPAQPDFPLVKRDDSHEFDVHEDVRKADAFLSRVIRSLREQGGGPVRILEIGSGVHPVAMRACDDTSLVVVSDISLVMQRLAAIMHQDHPVVRNGRGGFASFDMMHPPFARGSFDVVCICAALHHIPRPVEFLRKLVPLLSPRGRFVALREPCVVDPTAPTYISELSNGFNEQMFELPEWSNMLAESGLAVDQASIDYTCSLKFSARAS